MGKGRKARVGSFLRSGGLGRGRVPAKSVGLSVGLPFHGPPFHTGRHSMCAFAYPLKAVRYGSECFESHPCAPHTARALPVSALALLTAAADPDPDLASSGVPLPTQPRLAARCPYLGITLRIARPPVVVRIWSDV
jgi:hypothetical protein